MESSKSWLSSRRTQSVTEILVLCSGEPGSLRCAARNIGVAPAVSIPTLTTSARDIRGRTFTAPRSARSMRP
jgi:hypothetical protein